VVLALVLRQPAASPADDSTPVGVVHNYYLAVERGDLARAFAYLSSDTRA
jgi:hypothetical protein